MRAESPRLSPRRVRDLSDRIEAHRFFQYAFLRQWRGLRRYANARGIRIIGDLPVFVALDSADVWARPHLWKLDPGGQSHRRGGGAARRVQRHRAALGQPALRLGPLREDGLRVVDRPAARDHEARRRHAARPLPRVRRVLGSAGDRSDGGARPVGGGVRARAAADDARARSGAICRSSPRTSASSRDDVHALREAFGFPGMRVLQFAWDGDCARFAPASRVPAERRRLYGHP